MNRSVDSGKTLCRPPRKSRRGRSLLLPVPRLVRHPMPSPQVQVVRRSGSEHSIRRLPLGIIRNRHRTAMPTTPRAGRAGHTKRVQRRQGLLRGLRGDAHRQRSKLGPKPQTVLRGAAYSFACAFCTGFIALLLLPGCEWPGVYSRGR